MKQSTGIAIGAALLVAAAGLWFLVSEYGGGRAVERISRDNTHSLDGSAHQDGGLAESPVAGAGDGRPAVAANPKEPPPIPPDRKFERPPPGAPSTAPAAVLPPPPPAGSGNGSVSRDFEKIKLMLRDYRTLMGENPVGTNAEIMKSITGANQKGAKLGPPEGMSLNNYGELVDPWGTAFFFHQLSGTQMEIRSAGPDRKMWTGDDVISK